MAVVILGSYRKHFDKIARARDVFRAAGWEVVIPVGDIVDEADGFVRLSSDEQGLDPVSVEAKVIKYALEADVVYFVCPDGYIGRTACYELGRLIQAGRTVYFSDLPEDLPVAISEKAVVSPSQLVAHAG